MRILNLLIVVATMTLASCSGNTVKDLPKSSGAAASTNNASTNSTSTNSTESADETPTPTPSAGSGTTESSTKGLSARQGAEDGGGQDERYRQLVVGTWEDDYQGHRTMTLNEDGTATLVVELSGMKAKLFAARLEFNMRWSLQDGRLKKRTIDGKPEGRVKMILKMMGDRVDEPILELTEERLLLLDKDGKTRYDWRRKKSGTTVPVVK